MASFITLELDTTPPKLQIYAPNYTTKNTDLNLTIIASEMVDKWQEIYLIDREGKKHDFTFHIDNKEIIGLIPMANIPLGIATIYARLRDELHNVSDLYSFSFSVIEYAPITIEFISEGVSKLATSENIYTLSPYENINDLVSDEKLRTLITRELTAKMVVMEGTD